MKKDIILSGVGGQGILSIATVIGKAALKEGLYMKQAEVHGMSQRGGDVQSNLRISDKPIASDLIPSGKCDLIISLEPMEGLRYLPYLSPEGWLVTNETPFVNIPNYPEEDKVMAEINKLPHKICLLYTSNHDLRPNRFHTLSFHLHFSNPLISRPFYFFKASLLPDF